MPPRSRQKPEIPGQGDLLVDLAGNQSPSVIVPEERVATAGVARAMVGESSTKEPDPNRAMGLLDQSIKMLGGSNKMNGLQRYATLERGEADLKQRYGSKYWYVIGVTEGAGDTLRRHAFYSYCEAAEAMAGRRLKQDDPTVILGFRAFAGVYGRVGRSAQNARRTARVELNKARATNAPQIPIKHFYDPELEVYADSSLKLKTQWEDISERITREDGVTAEDTSGYVDTSVNGLLREVLWPDRGTRLLPEKDEHLVIDNTDNYAAKICSVIQAPRRKKIRDGLTDETPQDALAAGFRGVREALGAHQSAVNKRLAELRGQFDIVDQTAAYLAGQNGEQAYRDYSVTNKTLDTVARITDELISGIAASRNYDEEKRKVLSADIKAQLQGPSYARGFMDVLAAHNQARQNILEQNGRSLAATLAPYEHVPTIV